MNRHMARGLLACATLIVVLSAPAVARADVIGDWNATAQAEAVLIRPTAHGQARGMAMVQGAVYDAVNAVVRTHQPYLLDLDDVDVQPFVSQDAAVATAAHHVLVKIVAPERVAALDTAYQTTLQGIPDGPIEQGGVEAGEAAAQAMLDARAGRRLHGRLQPDDRHRRRRLAADRLARDAGVRSRRLGRQPQAVRDQEPVAVPLGRPERPDERRVRQGLQRGEGARGAEQHEADRGPDHGGRLLAVPARGALQPARPRARRTRPLRPRHLQAGSPLRDGEPRDGRRRDQLLERQVPLVVLAAAGGDPRGRDRRECRDDRRPALGVALPPVDGRRAGDAALPRPPVGARLRERRGPADVPGVLRNGQDRVRHPLGPVPEPATALRAVLARDEGGRRLRASGAGSTSGRPTCREP